MTDEQRQQWRDLIARLGPERVEVLRAAVSPEGRGRGRAATRKEFETDRTCWWQSGRREQFQAEAADCAYAKVTEPVDGGRK